MCNGSGILNQFKSMAGLDWASLSDNLTREVLVLALDSPESFEAIDMLYTAGKCAAEVGLESAEGALTEAESATGEQGSEEDWNVFQADVPEEATAAVDEAASKAAACVDTVNMYEVGKIGGKLFAKFFDN